MRGRLNTVAATFEDISARLTALESQRDREGELLDDLEGLLRELAGADLGTLERARRAAQEMDRASAQCARARRDLADALAALATSPKAANALRAPTPTVKVRALPRPKPDGDAS